MNVWHDVAKERVTPDSFLALIEISKGSKNKYELDKATGRLILDRVLFTSTHYPHNYGFIPLTYADDHDPLDVLVICSESILPMAFVQCKPLGVMRMKDNGAEDEKIIAVPIHDPFYSSYEEIEELPDHVRDEIIHFFSVYKTLEGKSTFIQTFDGKETAKKIIQSCLDNYQKVIVPTLKK